ncbi:MAG: murein hydrolase activator [Betaproteobacteria bacterium]
MLTPRELAKRFDSPPQDGVVCKSLFEPPPSAKRLPHRGGCFPGLREIGILLMIGHGDSDMSLSGGNEPLFEQVCGAIRTRGRNAPAADSGEDPDSGLYFGTRLAGRPSDPITWVSVQ